MSAQKQTPFSNTELVENLILIIRGQKVMLDSDLARIYGVSTKAFNRAVKRNKKRFPEDFLFQLTAEESNRCQFGTGSQKHRDPRFLPYVFTEHGALMAANVLKSDRAAAMSVYVIRAFVRLREVFSINQILKTRLTEIEKTLLTHDSALRDVYKKLKPLLFPKEVKPKRKIGFHNQD